MPSQCVITREKLGADARKRLARIAKEFGGCFVYMGKVPGNHVTGWFVLDDGLAVDRIADDIRKAIARDGLARVYGLKHEEVRS